MADSARGSPADESSSSGNRPRSGVRSATTGDPTAARCTPKRGMPESSPLGAQHRRTRSRSALARHSANAAIASASAIGLRANASSISSWVPSAIAARSFAFSNLSRSVSLPPSLRQPHCQYAARISDGIPPRYLATNRASASPSGSHPGRRRARAQPRMR